MDKRTIYCVHPINGLSFKDVTDYYTYAVAYLQNCGYDVLYPLVARGECNRDMTFRATGSEKVPCATNHAIYERDRWMVQQSDIVFADLTGAKRISIGSVMELAWASYLGKHTVVAMEKTNIHRHAFTLEAADIIFETGAEALTYLQELNKR